MLVSPRAALFGLALAGLATAMTMSEAWAQAWPVPALASPDAGLGLDAQAKRRLRAIDQTERPLRQAREALDACAETTCITPSEAAAMAFVAGPEEAVSGRFILDVRSASGPTNRWQPPNKDLFYIGSERDFRRFGTLVVAIERDALGGVLNAETATESSASPVPATSGRMRKYLHGQRLIVDGEAQLQWVEHPDWETGQRNGRGYYQVWVNVTSPDQVRIVGS